MFKDTQNTREQFAYMSNAWRKLNLIVCYLSEQHRQEDETFLEFLSAVRHAKVSEKHKDILRTRYSKIPREDVTQLYSHNENVDRINESKLEKLSGDAEVFHMGSQGSEKLVMSLKRGCLSPEKLCLKVGARVMFTKNDVAKHKFVNGTLGAVTGFNRDAGYPIIRTNYGRTILAEPMDWSLEDRGRILARITQIPLRLAWAMTVHKSQGMSLDSAHMDLSDTFEYGQGYVALSRVRTLQGLSLAGLNARALEVHPEILETDVSFRETSQKAREVFGVIPKDELLKMHKNFIRACGGNSSPGNKRQLKPAKIPTHEITLGLLLQKLTLEEISKKRGLALGTITAHLETLSLEKKINPSRDLAHIPLEDGGTIAKIHDAFHTLGPAPLKPIFDYLGGRIPYETIRFARIFFDDNRKM